MLRKVTGVAYKHHLSEDFKKNPALRYDNGAGKGATIFLDRKAMEAYLLEDGREWHVAELYLENETLNFNHGTDTMATAMRGIKAVTPFNTLAHFRTHWPPHTLTVACFVVTDDIGQYLSKMPFFVRPIMTAYRPDAHQFRTLDEAETEIACIGLTADIERLTVQPSYQLYGEARDIG